MLRLSTPGSLVRQLATADALIDDRRADVVRSEEGADGGAEVEAEQQVRHVAFLASGRSAAETLERAVCSIAFKSHLAMPLRLLT